MKRFAFPLQRVLEWRRSRVDIEQSRLEQLLGERSRLKEAAAQLEAALAGARRAVFEPAAAGEPVDRGALAALDDFTLYVKHRRQLLLARRTELDQQIAAQRARLVVARRDFRLLDKLRERALAGWELEYAKELENLASELHLARWSAAPHREERATSKSARRSSAFRISSAISFE